MHHHSVDVCFLMLKIQYQINLKKLFGICVTNSRFFSSLKKIKRYLINHSNKEDNAKMYLMFVETLETISKMHRCKKL